MEKLCNLLRKDTVRTCVTIHVFSELWLSQTTTPFASRGLVANYTPSDVSFW